MHIVIPSVFVLVLSFVATYRSKGFTLYRVEMLAVCKALAKLGGLLRQLLIAQLL